MGLSWLNRYTNQPQEKTNPKSGPPQKEGPYRTKKKPQGSKSRPALQKAKEKQEEKSDLQA